MEINAEYLQIQYMLPAAVLSTFFITLAYCFYNVFLHPLRKFPGHKIAAASYMWHMYYLNKGTLYLEVDKLHKKHGSIVRISPNELSIIDSQSWNEIYGHRVKPEMLKDELVYGKSTDIGQGIIALPTVEHRIVRRTLLHGFSEKALREQEHLIKHYLGQFMDGIREKSNNGQVALDMVAWYNFFTFDVIGDLAFGEPFGCLESGAYHDWVSLIFSLLQYNALERVMRVYGNSSIVKRMIKLMAPKNITREAATHYALTIDKIDRRVNRKEERMDFLEKIIHSKERPPQLSLPALGNELIIAGSETTATWLSGTTYYLIKNPAVLEKVKNEVRSAFEKYEDITVLAASQLKYMNAVLEESLRMYPPAPGSLPRSVPAGGATIAGKYVPGGTSIGVAQYSAFRCEDNFTRPNEFLPERFLGDPEFENDKKSVFNPFSFGPRNCIGKNLAYAEARLVLASVLLNYDFKLDPSSENWTDQGALVVWAKKPLIVYLVPRTV